MNILALFLVYVYVYILFFMAIQKAELQCN